MSKSKEEVKERCSAELHLEKYFGFDYPGDEREIVTSDYGQFVNMLVMYRDDELKKFKVKLKNEIEISCAKHFKYFSIDGIQRKELLTIIDNL